MPQRKSSTRGRGRPPLRKPASPAAKSKVKEQSKDGEDTTESKSPSSNLKICKQSDNPSADRAKPVDSQEDLGSADVDLGINNRVLLPQPPIDASPVPPRDDDPPQKGDPNQLSWAQVVAQGTLRDRETETLSIKQPPHFELQYVKDAAESDEITITDEEVDEGRCQWKNTLVGCVMGAEVSRENMDRFVRSKWKKVVHALEGNMPLDDLSDGLAPGDSGIFSSFECSDYSSMQYKEDLKKFRKMALESQELVSNEYSAPTSEYGLNPSSSSTEGQGTTGDMETPDTQKLTEEIMRSS